MTAAQQLIEEGLQEGLQKGLQKGRQEGIQTAIIETLELRFGDVPSGVKAAIEAIYDEAQLHALHRASVVSQSMEDFTKPL